MNWPKRPSTAKLSDTLGPAGPGTSEREASPGTAKIVVENKGGTAMLNTIGESAVRTTTRVDNNLAVENKDVALKKDEKKIQERPIESAQEGAKPESEVKQKTGGYKADDGGIFFEKYDKNGNVIFRTPPEQKPIDQRV
jgi:hypothetical protein